MVHRCGNGISKSVPRSLHKESKEERGGQGRGKGAREGGGGAEGVTEGGSLCGVFLEQSFRD